MANITDNQDQARALENSSTPVVPVAIATEAAIPIATATTNTTNTHRTILAESINFHDLLERQREELLEALKKEQALNPDNIKVEKEEREAIITFLNEQKERMDTSSSVINRFKNTILNSMIGNKKIESIDTLINQIHNSKFANREEMEKAIEKVLSQNRNEATHYLQAYLDKKESFKEISIKVSHEQIRGNIDGIKKAFDIIQDHDMSKILKIPATYPQKDKMQQQLNFMLSLDSDLLQPKAHDTFSFLELVKHDAQHIKNVSYFIDEFYGKQYNKLNPQVELGRDAEFSIKPSLAHEIAGVRSAVDDAMDACGKCVDVPIEQQIAFYATKERYSKVLAYTNLLTDFSTMEEPTKQAANKVHQLLEDYKSFLHEPAISNDVKNAMAKTLAKTEACINAHPEWKISLLAQKVSTTVSNDSLDDILRHPPIHHKSQVVEKKSASTSTPHQNPHY